jgi:hypothetical protein
VIALAGTVNPSAGSVSVFVPLEHAVLAGSVADRARTSMFARYSLTGALAGAFGALAAATPDFLGLIGMSQLAPIKAMFVLYAVLGIAGGLIYARLPARQRPPSAPDGATTLGPSRGIVYKLAALFSLDAFAGGFVVQSLLALWLFERFELSLASASVLFFWSGVLSAFSFPVAAWLSGRIGLVNTMVFTHIPSSLCLILAAIAPTLSLARPAADPGGTVADGRAHPLLLRDGGRNRDGAGSGGQLHLRAAQPGGRREPGARRRALLRLVPRLAARHLRAF